MSDLTITFLLYMVIWLLFSLFCMNLVTKDKKILDKSDWTFAALVIAITMLFWPVAMPVLLFAAYWRSRAEERDPGFKPNMRYDNDKDGRV